MGFIRGRCVHCSSPWKSTGSSRVAAFIGVRALGVVGFIQGHWGAHYGLSGTSGVAGFIAVRPRARRVHPGPLGSLGYALVVVEFIRCGWVH